MEAHQNLEIIDSIHSDANFLVSSSPKDKRKKKKKSSSNIHSFDEAKQHKLDKDKVKLLHKSPPFPASSPCPIPQRFTKAFEYEDAQDFGDSSPGSPYPFSSSCPSRSALRGGHEGLGLGPRPKLHVKWAVDVRDPPKSSMSHTLRINQRGDSKKQRKNKKKAKSKRKTINSAGLKQQPSCDSLTGSQEDSSCASDVSDAEQAPGHGKPDDNVSSTVIPVALVETFKTASASPALADVSGGRLSFLEVAMQHMLLASSFIAKENVAGALIEYKAAAHVFRLAKLEAESLSVEKSEMDEDETVNQALRGQILAWIAMATLYSARGQLPKGQKCHNLAMEACQDLGLSLTDSIEWLKNMNGFQSLFFKTSGSSNHCSLAASLAACDNSCDKSRTEII